MMTTKQRLEHLEDKINDFSDDVENCRIQGVNYNSEVIGSIVESLDHGRNIQSSEPDKNEQIEKFKLLTDRYNVIKAKLRECNCSKK